MAKKRKIAKTNDQSKDLWIAQRYSLKGPAGERAWENRPGGAPSSTRYLELADIALGLKKSAPRSKKSRLPSVHHTKKPEPYTPR